MSSKPPAELATNPPPEPAANLEKARPSSAELDPGPIPTRPAARHAYHVRNTKNQLHNFNCDHLRWTTTARKAAQYVNNPVAKVRHPGQFDVMMFFWSHHDILIDFMTNLMTSWRIFWRYDDLFDVMTFFWCIDDLLTFLCRNDVFLTPWRTFWCDDVSLTLYDELVDVVTYILTSWRNVMMNFWCHEVSLTSWRRFCSDDMLLTSWRIFDIMTKTCDVMTSSWTFWLHDEFVGVMSCFWRHNVLFNLTLTSFLT